jgi:hypothetical protein
MGAQVQILLVSTFLSFSHAIKFTGNLIILAYRCWQFYCTLISGVAMLQVRTQGAH